LLQKNGVVEKFTTNLKKVSLFSKSKVFFTF
jgi:hypothetical protein